MELALTALIWTVLGIIVLGFIIWLTVLVIAMMRARKARKVVNKHTAQMMRDIEDFFKEDK